MNANTNVMKTVKTILKKLVIGLTVGSAVFSGSSSSCSDYGRGMTFGNFDQGRPGQTNCWEDPFDTNCW
jgi:hypothetical protein